LAVRSGEVTANSLHRKPAALDAVLFQPLDRQVDVVGAQIGKAAALEVLALRAKDVSIGSRGLRRKHCLRLGPQTRKS